MTDFEGYMETVLATYGSIAARRELFMEYAGHRKKPLRLDQRYWQRYWQGKRESLDEIIAGARKRHES